MHGNSKIKITFNLLNKKEIIFIFIILIASSFGMILEFLSLSSIPIFFSSILELTTENNSFFSKIKNFITAYFDDVNLILILIILIFFFKSFFLYLLRIFEFIVFKKIRIRLSELLINKYIKPDFNLEIEDTAATQIWKIEIINNFTGVIEHFVSMVRNIGYILSIVLFLILFSSNSIFYTIFVLFIIVFVYFLFFSKKLKETGQLSDLGRKDKVNSVQDIINGVKDINIFERFDYFIKKFKLSNIKLEKYSQKNLIISSLPFYFLEFFGVLIIILFFFFLKSENLNNSEIVVSISVLAYSGIRVIGLLKTCVNNLNFCKKSSFVIGVLLDETFKENGYKKNHLNLINYQSNLKNNIILKINNLSYEYKNRNKIFTNINLEIENNKIYCLRGKSGSGKSTFLDILLGIKNFSSGEILIKHNRSEIGYVSQECYIKEDTIKNNIAFGIDPVEIDDERVLKAAKEAQIYDFIKSLPLKFETKLNPFGSNISIGQKQRIGIARTLYNNSKILLLDEPTSALDPETEKKFMNILQKLKKDRLIIMTTHRSNINEYYDYILKIENNSVKQIKI